MTQEEVTERWNPARDRVQQHVRTPGGTCSIDGEKIVDAPDTGLLTGGVQLGYMALFPARYENGDPMLRIEIGDNNRQNAVMVHPAHRRTLCRKHYLEEWHEMYPGQEDPDLDAGPRHVRERLGL